MSYDEESYQQRRLSCLPVMLSVMFGSFFMLLLVLITGGWFLYMLGVLAGVTLFAMFHWVVWGRALTQSLSREIEEERRRQQEDADNWPGSDSYRSA
jgi:hypothetical protein